MPFQISKEISFCYGHRLLNYSGKCRHLHGHNGRVELILDGVELDDRGMLVDFGDVKAPMKHWIDTNLDHRMLLNSSDPIIPYLQGVGEPLFLMDSNPTAENIAKTLYIAAKELKLPVTQVRFWETDTSTASYRE
ncbi:MAG: 6-carboxytetrahydropterin synthase [Pirellulaceae bacterium]